MNILDANKTCNKAKKIKMGKGMCIFLTSLLGLSFNNKIKKILVIINFGRKT